MWRGEEAPAVRRGCGASGHPCSFSLGMRFCHIKSRPPTRKGPADRGAPLRLHGHTSLFLCSPRPLPPVGPSAQTPRRLLYFSRLRPPGGSAGCRRCCLSHWSPHCFSLVLSLPTGLLAGWGRGGAQALPSLGNRVIRTPQASPLLRGFWPRCWDWHPSKVGVGECGRHRVGSWPLSVAVQKLLGVSGHS